MDVCSSVDRNARNQLIKALEAFFGSRTTAFEFEDRVREITNQTRDPVVHKTEEWIASCFLDDTDWKYEGGKDKESWDFFQRIILLLRSDAQVGEVRPPWPNRLLLYSVRLGAATFLVAYVAAWLMASGPAIAISFHIVGFTMLAVAVVVSIFKGTKRSEALFPFNSVGELLAVRRTVPGFKKHYFQETQTIRPSQSRLRRLGLLAWEGVGIAAYAVMILVAVFLLFCGIPIVALILILYGYRESQYILKLPRTAMP